MGTEPLGESAPTIAATSKSLQRICYEELRNGGVDIHGYPRRAGLQLGEGTRQSERRTCGLGPAGVCLELSAAADGHLNDGRPDRSQNESHETDNGVATFAAAPTGPEGEPREERQSGANGGRYRGNEDVAVLDVSQLVGENALELVVA